MDTSRLEELLQEAVNQNAAVIEKLDDIVSALADINKELNWVGQHTFAKRIVDQLDEVERAVRDIGS